MVSEHQGLIQVQPRSSVTPPAELVSSVSVESNAAGFQRSKVTAKDEQSSATLRIKMGIVKHTVEELAYFLVELGMEETTAHDAMVKELLREAPLGSHKDLRSCGEYHWQLQKRRMATRVSEPSHL
jgi:hypothetical protein